MIGGDENDELPDDDFPDDDFPDDNLPIKDDGTKTDDAEDLDALPDDDDFVEDLDAASEQVDDFEIEETSSVSNAAKQKELIDLAIRDIKQGKKDCPGIPVIMMFGYSTSGKSTLAYRLQEDAIDGGYKVEPEVWKKYESDEDEAGLGDSDEIYAVGTTAIHAYVFQQASEKDAKKKGIGARQIIIDCPGEYWSDIVDIDWRAAAKGTLPVALKNKLKSMLSMMSLCTGYIFALESEQVFIDYVEPTLEEAKDSEKRAEARKKARAYKKLYRNIALITDLDTRLTEHLSHNKTIDDAILALIADKSGSKPISYKMGKPAFVAFTKTDRLALRILTDFAKRNAGLASDEFGLIEKLQTALNDFEHQSIDELVTYGPSTVLRQYAEDIIEFCENNITQRNTKTRDFLEGYYRPTYGAISATQRLFAQLCENVKYLRFDFVSPFDGMKPRIIEVMGQEQELPPFAKLPSFGVKENIGWLRNLAIEYDKPRSRFKRLRAVANNDSTEALAKIWIAKSEAKNAMRFRDANKKFKPTLRRKLLYWIIGGDESRLKSDLRLNKLAIFSTIFAPLIVLLLGSMVWHKAVSQDVETKLAPKFELSFEDVTTKTLLNDVKAELGTDRLVYDGYMLPWQGIPKDKMSFIRNVWTLEDGTIYYCKSKKELCRGKADLFRKTLWDAAETLGYQVSDPKVELRPEVRTILEAVVIPDHETAEGSGNTKTFLAYHHGLLNLYFGSQGGPRSSSNPKIKFGEVISGINTVKSYPFGGSTSNSLSTPILEALEAAENKYSGADRDSYRTIVTRLMMLHISALQGQGLAELQTGNYRNARRNFSRASYLASYQNRGRSGRKSVHREWIKKLVEEEQMINKIEWSRLENNRILATFLASALTNEATKDTTQDKLRKTNTVAAFESLTVALLKDQKSGKAITNEQIQVPAINAKILRALLAISDDEVEAHDKALDDVDFVFDEKPLGQKLRANHSLASIILADRISDTSLSIVAEAYADNPNFQMLIASLKAREDINQTPKFTLNKNARLVPASEMANLKEVLGIEQADQFLNVFERETGKALSKQARKAYRLETSANGKLLIDQLLAKAPWLSMPTKIDLKMRPIFGFGLIVGTILAIMSLLLGAFIFRFLRNTQTNYARIFQSHHISDAQTCMIAEGLSDDIDRTL